VADEDSLHWYRLSTDCNQAFTILNLVITHILNCVIQSKIARELVLALSDLPPKHFIASNAAKYVITYYPHAHGLGLGWTGHKVVLFGTHNRKVCKRDERQSADLSLSHYIETLERALLRIFVTTWMLLSERSARQD